MRYLAIMALFITLSASVPIALQVTENIAYTYDALGRLTGVTYVEKNITVVYTYDKAGNRLSKVISGVVGGTPLPVPVQQVVVLPIGGFVVLPIN